MFDLTEAVVTGKRLMLLELTEKERNVGVSLWSPLFAVKEK